MIAAAVSVALACAVNDDAGKMIELSQPAKRIISLTPGTTETLFAIGAGNQIVGTINGSDYPLAAQRIPLVGTYTRVDTEQIIALHPDLIITWGSLFPREVERFQHLGIPVYISQPHSIKDVLSTVQRLGCLTGHKKEANQLTQTFTQQLLVLQKRHPKQKPLIVFYQLGYSLQTINKTSWINEAIELCGGQNYFKGSHWPAPTVTWESILQINPDLVINDAGNVSWKKDWQQWPKLNAVKNKNLFTVSADWVDRPGPRLILGVQQICYAIEQVREKNKADSSKKD